jgi:hypothetical protein
LTNSIAGKIGQAEKFAVVDQAGKVRVQIGLTAQGDPSITLLDNARRPMIQLVAGNGAAGLTIGGKEQPALALFGVDNHGAPISSCTILTGRSMPVWECKPTLAPKMPDLSGVALLFLFFSPSVRRNLTGQNDG